jgi:hypothetical protein
MSSTGLNQRSFASYGYKNGDEEARLKKIHDYFKDLKEEQFDKENFEVMLTEAVEEKDSVPSSHKDPTEPEALSVESPGAGEI